jgi:hypothetical protein
MSEWEQPKSPPAPLFLNKKERDLVKQVNDELIERVIGQQILYYSIDLEHTNFHPIYGEAMHKTFLPPVRVYALVNLDLFETSFLQGGALDKKKEITVKFHKRRLTDDQNLFVSEGDFVLYSDLFFEIVTLTEPKQLFGQMDHRFEIAAKCIYSRKGLFDGR